MTDDFRQRVEAAKGKTTAVSAVDSKKQLDEKTHALAFDTGVLGDYFGSVRAFLRFRFKHQF